jgi:hypothetical protein
MTPTTNERDQQMTLKEIIQAEMDKLGIPWPYYPGQSFTSSSGIHYRIVATDSRDRIAMEISSDGIDWHRIDVGWH